MYAMQRGVDGVFEASPAMFAAISLDATAMTMFAVRVAVAIWTGKSGDGGGG